MCVTLQNIALAGHRFTSCAVLCNWYLDDYFVYGCLTDGERDGLRWPALSGHCLSCTGCWLYLLNMKQLMCGKSFLHISIFIWCFWPWIIFPNKNRLHRLPQTSSIWDLHSIVKIISRGAPGLATDSPCGVWGCGWTTCQLAVWWSNFRFYVFDCQLVWKFDMVERDFSIDFFLLFMFYT